MFGSAPRHGDQTGIQPDHWRSNNPHDNTQLILDKINELDRRLTKQMTCSHGPFEYKFQNGLGAVMYRKTCKACDLKVGSVTMREKMDEELAEAKNTVARIEKAIERDFPKKEDNQ